MNKLYPRASVLFICTGNYYRSRIAEIIFNYYAGLQSVEVNAFSRGLRLNPVKNTGLISPHAAAFLANLNISDYPTGSSRQLEESDFEKANRIILMDEKEHRPMMKERFPDWENKVEYWRLEDDYLVDPNVMLPELEKKVRQLIQSLR